MIQVVFFNHYTEIFSALFFMPIGMTMACDERSQMLRGVEMGREPRQEVKG